MNEKYNQYVFYYGRDYISQKVSHFDLHVKESNIFLSFFQVHILKYID